jgi:hypothetical protein
VFTHLVHHNEEDFNNEPSKCQISSRQVARCHSGAVNQIQLKPTLARIQGCGNPFNSSIFIAQTIPTIMVEKKLTLRDAAAG